MVIEDIFCVMHIDSLVFLSNTHPKKRTEQKEEEEEEKKTF